MPRDAEARLDCDPIFPLPDSSLLSPAGDLRRSAASIPRTTIRATSSARVARRLDSPRLALIEDRAFDPRSISPRKREGSLATATVTERETSRDEQTIYIDNTNRP
jgi:hypothetical protein